MTAALRENDGLPAGLRVLIVEDEMLLAFMLQDMLAEWGCDYLQGVLVGLAKISMVYVMFAKAVSVPLTWMVVEVG